MPEEIDIEQEFVDDAEDHLDEADELQESQLDAYGAGTYPEQKQQENIYNWFWKVVNLKIPIEKVVKVGNLTATEIGVANISVRDAINLSNLGQIFHHPTFGNYFANLAKVTAVTSMAKKGWFMDLSISQKRVRERQRADASSEKQPWRMFGKKKKQNPQED